MSFKTVLQRSGLIGSEMCSCVINHLLFDRWQQTVECSQNSSPSSRRVFPLSKRSICANATSPLIAIFKSRVSKPISPSYSLNHHKKFRRTALDPVKWRGGTQSK